MGKPINKTKQNKGSKMELIKIKLSPSQVGWIDWMEGGVSFSEYDSESFARDRGIAPKEHKEYIEAFDQVGFPRRDPLEFEFPNHEEVVSEIQFELGVRLIDILEDGKTGYWEENDRKIFGEQQSVRSLLRKINNALKE